MQLQEHPAEGHPSSDLWRPGEGEVSPPLQPQSDFPFLHQLDNFINEQVWLNLLAVNWKLHDAV